MNGPAWTGSSLDEDNAAVSFDGVDDSEESRLSVSSPAIASLGDGGGEDDVDEDPSASSITSETGASFVDSGPVAGTSSPITNSSS
jgi:hypothetical protein